MIFNHFFAPSYLLKSFYRHFSIKEWIVAQNSWGFWLILIFHSEIIYFENLLNSLYLFFDIKGNKWEKNLMLK